MRALVRDHIGPSLVAGLLAVAMLVGVAVAGAASKRAATASAPCVFVPGGATSCTSSDSTVAVDFLNSVDTSGCTFSVTIQWGDGGAVTVRVTGGRAGRTPLASHLYRAAGSYPIAESGQVVSGHCAIAAVTYHVTIGSAAPPAPVPVRSRRVVLVLVSGTVDVPTGTNVEASDGVVRVVVLEDGSVPQSALVYGGRFIVTQPSTPPYIAVFALSQPLTGCAGVTPSAVGVTLRDRGRPGGPRHGPTRRHLWVEDSGGKYETTTGQISGSNVGTQWLTTQDCTSSQVSVVSGTVSVFDAIDGTTTTVQAHESYTAHAHEHEAALGPVESYWAAIEAHAFARAWGYVVAGTIGSQQGSSTPRTPQASRARRSPERSARARARAPRFAC